MLNTTENWLDDKNETCEKKKNNNYLIHTLSLVITCLLL